MDFVTSLDWSGNQRYWVVFHYFLSESRIVTDGADYADFFKSTPRTYMPFGGLRGTYAAYAGLTNVY